jgi:two-component system, chemotaxis family, protein-glutamate methylesterase/glutaminase
VTPPAAAAPRRVPDSACRPPTIKLMIVDDSPIARAVLSRMLSAHKEFEVVALAGNAGEAIDALGSIRVDIVLLDVEMPGTTGLEALPEILKLGGGARVLIVSSLCEDGAEAAVQALALGAADTLPKPGTGNFAGRFSEILAERLRRIGRADPAEAAAGEPDERPPLRLREAPEHKLGCVALGASTGGLHALTEFLRALPAMIGAPILVTQHLPAVFMPYFARQIQTASGRTTRVAEDGLAVRPEEILLAPGDAHLGLERQGGCVRVRLGREPVAGGYLPSVDHMLNAVGAIYGKSAAGVVLSGMGRDGLAGSRGVVERGGVILAQDRQSSAVWGMPRAVAEAGLASAVLPPADLARRIAARASGAAWK